MQERYLAAIDDAQPRFAEVFRALGREPQDGATLFHCTAGKDRTGLVAAMLLTLAEVEPAEIVQDYTMTSTAAREFIARLGRMSRMQKTPRHVIEKLLATPAEAMEGVLDHLDTRYGGVASYLERAGVSPTEIDRAAALLRG